MSIFTGEVGAGVTDREVRLARQRLGKRVARLLTPKKPSRGESVFEFSQIIASELLRVHRQNPIDVLEMEGILRVGTPILPSARIFPW